LGCIVAESCGEVEMVGGEEWLGVPAVEQAVESLLCTQSSVAVGRTLRRYITTVPS
jgi:hypothetical protein